MEKPQNHKHSKKASYLLVCIGLLLVTLWFFALKPWEGKSEVPFLFFLNETFSYFLLIVLLLGIYLLGLGLLRLLHASWDKNKKNN